jgi:hypothetical protein
MTNVTSDDIEISHFTKNTTLMTYGSFLHPKYEISILENISAMTAILVEIH